MSLGQAHSFRHLLAGQLGQSRRNQCRASHDRHERPEAPREPRPYSHENGAKGNQGNENHGRVHDEGMDRQTRNGLQHAHTVDRADR